MHLSKPRRDLKPPPPPPPPPSTSTRQKADLRAPEGSGSPPTSAAASPSPSEVQVDRELLESLMDIIHLFESLTGQPANNSFRQRASEVYTAAPTNPKKAIGSKCQKSTLGKRREDNTHDKQVGRDKQDGEGDEFSVVSSRSLQKEREEMNVYRDQMDDVQRRLVQKDKHMKEVEGSLKELKREIMEKDAVIKSTHSQLNNAKIKLADKQAALEKSVWEAREAKNNNMKLQEKLDSIDLEVSSFMRLFMELSRTKPTPPFDDDIAHVHCLEELPIWDVDENVMGEARVAYANALAAAKENPSEETLRVASEARTKLQSFVL